ncbi:MAG: hypothetical protein JWQ88_1176 [Rhodoferax sp.]|nr:hypothetical protein [Rhodoferax sp.]
MKHDTPPRTRLASARTGAPAWALAGLCGAAACLPLALGRTVDFLPSWLWVAGGLAGICGAARLLLAAPSQREAQAQHALFDDEESASRNAELRAELTR